MLSKTSISALRALVFLAQPERSRAVRALVDRPTRDGGRGFNFTGPHEILVPLLHARELVGFLVVNQPRGGEATFVEKRGMIRFIAEQLATLLQLVAIASPILPEVTVFDGGLDRVVGGAVQQMTHDRVGAPGARSGH